MSEARRKYRSYKLKLILKSCTLVRRKRGEQRLKEISRNYNIKAVAGQTQSYANLHGTPGAGQPGVVSSSWDQEDTKLEESWN